MSPVETALTAESPLGGLSTGEGIWDHSVPSQCSMSARSLLARYWPTAQTSVAETASTPERSAGPGPGSGAGPAAQAEPSQRPMTPQKARCSVTAPPPQPSWVDPTATPTSPPEIASDPIEPCPGDSALSTP